MGFQPLNFPVLKIMKKAKRSEDFKNNYNWSMARLTVRIYRDKLG